MSNRCIWDEKEKRIKRGKEKFIEIFEQRAELGDAEAMLNLGACYQNGKGVPQDIAKAIEWYVRAARFGNSAALYNLAVCFDNEICLPQNEEKAKQLL